VPRRRLIIDEVVVALRLMIVILYLLYDFVILVVFAAVDGQSVCEIRERI
jgi:hypothetical protein